MERLKRRLKDSNTKHAIAPSRTITKELMEREQDKGMLSAEGSLKWLSDELPEGLFAVLEVELRSLCKQVPQLQPKMQKVKVDMQAEGRRMALTYGADVTSPQRVAAKMSEASLSWGPGGHIGHTSEPHGETSQMIRHAVHGAASLTPHC